MGAISWPGDVETVCATEGATVTISDEDRVRSDQAYDEIALSIAAFEASPEVNAFTSKYDLTKGGKVKLSKQEQKGDNRPGPSAANEREGDESRKQPQPRTS